MEWERLIDEHSWRLSVGAYRLYVSPDITASVPGHIRYQSQVLDMALGAVWQGGRYASVVVAKRVALEALLLETRHLLSSIELELSHPPA